MNAVATVTRVTPTAKWDAARTEIDIVDLSYDGRLYVWEAARGVYALGQEVDVNPPAAKAANITPRDGQ